MQRGCRFFLPRCSAQLAELLPGTLFFSCNFLFARAACAAASWALAPSCGRYAKCCRKLLPADIGFIGALAREPAVAPTTPPRAPPWLCSIHMLFMRHTFAAPWRPARFPKPLRPLGLHARPPSPPLSCALLARSTAHWLPVVARCHFAPNSRCRGAPCRDGPWSLPSASIEMQSR